MKLTRDDILSIPHMDAIGFDRVPDLAVTGVCTDSRAEQKGQIFLAIRGERLDGHNFVSQALRNGAAVVAVEKRWADLNAAMLVSIPVPKLIVENTTHAFGHLAGVYRSSFHIPVIAVGGSNGKTTTKEMIRSILARKYRVLATEGNHNNHIGVPQTLFRLEQEHEVAVVEVGTNHPGEIAYLCEFLRPTHGIITNIGREHLEFFGTVDGVADAEAELFTYLQKNKGTAFVNADDALLAKRAKPLTKKKTYGVKARAVSVKGRVASMNDHGCATVAISVPGKNAAELALSVPGVHNAVNAVAAATVGMAFRVPMGEIISALESFSAASKRMEVQRTGGITILNDTYNANPDSMIAALATLKAMRCAGSRIAVLSDMLELGPDAAAMHGEIGKAIASYDVDALFTFGPLSRHMHDQASIAAKVHYESKQQLMEDVLKKVSMGDAVLVKGSRGMKMEEVVAALAERFTQKGQA